MRTTMIASMVALLFTGAVQAQEPVRINCALVSEFVDGPLYRQGDYEGVQRVFCSAFKQMTASMVSGDDRHSRDCRVTSMGLFKELERRRPGLSIEQAAASCD